MAKRPDTEATAQRGESREEFERDRMGETGNRPLQAPGIEPSEATMDAISEGEPVKDVAANEPDRRQRAAPLSESELLGRAPLPLKNDGIVRKERERRDVSAAILARLLGNRTACEQLKLRVTDSGNRLTFQQVAARAAIEFADALIDELDAREKRI